MKEYYLLKEAMERLGLKSINAFRQLERKYPEAFVDVNQGKDKGKKPRYDRAALDRFIERREYFKQENP
jgi:hypothetical protein